jgi:hypothetical protein
VRGHHQDRDLAYAVAEPAAVAHGGTELLQRGTDRGAEQQRVERPVQRPVVVCQREVLRA